MNHRNIRKEFENKTILITGGTGSIGIGLTKELLKYKPKEIRIFTNDENSIFEMRGIIRNQTLKLMVGDVRDKDGLGMAIRGTDIVFHAAAMKHVDICEQNPFDAVKTNVVGTSNIIEQCILENISKFILISTDKATNPISTLGASKLLAERLTLNAGSYSKNGRTIFSIVRFGNVIGSRGSVFQIFIQQIRKKTPLTVTDTRMTRFIMSISEAAKLILKVTHTANDEEIFILKMPAVRIEELAKNMIHVYSKRFPNEKFFDSIKISKARKGERLHEFLITHDEIPFCYDLGDMWKLSKKKNKVQINSKTFSSETAPKISQQKLRSTLDELLDNYLSY